MSIIKARTFRSKTANFQKTQKGQTQQITEKKKKGLNWLDKTSVLRQVLEKKVLRDTKYVDLK